MPATLQEKQTFAPSDLARRYGSTVRKILNLIADGEIVAIDVSHHRGKPRWRITAEAVAAFERRRSSTANARAPRQRKAPTPDDPNVVDFFPNS
jgi:hypothetical protein